MVCSNVVRSFVGKAGALQKCSAQRIRAVSVRARSEFTFFAKVDCQLHQARKTSFRQRTQLVGVHGCSSSSF